MTLTLFLLVHMIIGLALIYFYGKLPKGIASFSYAFLGMSFIYVSTVLLNLFL